VEARDPRLSSSFEDVVKYLRGLIGRTVQVNIWPTNAPGAHLTGVVTAVKESPIGPAPEPRGYRFFCQVGDEQGNGFYIDPDTFAGAGVELVDPDTWGVWIQAAPDHFVVIEDDRIGWGDPKDSLPTDSA
jgi:hypothetical protein